MQYPEKKKKKPKQIWMRYTGRLSTSPRDLTWVANKQEEAFKERGNAWEDRCALAKKNKPEKNKKPRQIKKRKRKKEWVWTKLEVVVVDVVIVGVFFVILFSPFQFEFEFEFR